MAPSQYVEPFLDKKHRGALELARVKNFPFKKPDSLERLVLPLSFQVWTTSQLY